MGYNIYKHTCCLCNSHSARIKVCIQDNYQVLRDLPIVFKQYNPYSYLRMCNNCQMKLRIFIKCDTTDISQDFYKGMQDSPQHIEDTSCPCEHCKAKFGNLPLLAEVIEKIENTSPQQPPLEKTETVQHKTDIIPEQLDIPLNYSIKDGIEENTIQQPTKSKEPTTSKKIMNCEHCGKTFTHKGDMNKHLRKHTGEQPFSCHVCNRKFAHTSNLARHLKVHSGDKPFHCERCNKSFSRKDKLVMHQKTRLCMSAGHSSKS